MRIAPCPPASRDSGHWSPLNLSCRARRRRPRSQRGMSTGSRMESMNTVSRLLDAVTHRSVAGRDSRRDDQAAITEPDDGHLEALVEPLAGTQPLMASGAAWAMLGECALRQALQAFALPARPTLTESFPQPWTRLRLHARVFFRSTRLSAVIPASPVPSPRSSRTRRAGWRAGRSSTTSASMPTAARARATETR